MDDDLAASTAIARDEIGTAPAGADDPGNPGDGTPAATTGTEAVGTAEDGDAGGEPQRRRGRPKGSTAKTSRVVTMTLTVSGSADGEWQAELKQGSSWVARGLPVTAAAVSQAAAALHADLAGPVDEVIETAKAAKAARVAELEAELEQARKSLAQLEQ